jgi:hypothetical protein
MEKTYVVYLHKRADNGQVFYVGIGVKKRPKDKSNRNNFWHHVVNKYGYTVDIIHESLDRKTAEEYEKKYINEFGRRDLGKGNLVNLTDGGEGVLGVIKTDDEKELQRKIHSEKTGKEVYLYELYSEVILKFRSKRECNRFLNDNLILKGRIKGDKTFISGKYLLSYDEISQDDKNMLINKSKNVKLSVVQLDKEYNLINEYQSVRDAIRKHGVTVASVINPNTIHKTAYGYIWMYKKDYLKMVNEIMN